MDPIAALKKLTDAFDKVRTAEDKAALVEQADGLRGTLLDARQGVSDLQDKVTEQREEIAKLKTELAGRDAWDAEASRYKLSRMESGVYVYLFRHEAAGDDEPQHCACPKCFAERRKHVLQRQPGGELWADQDVYRATYSCPSCASKFSWGILPMIGPEAEQDRQNDEYERALESRNRITGY